METKSGLLHSSPDVVTKLLQNPVAANLCLVNFDPPSFLTGCTYGEILRPVALFEGKEEEDGGNQISRSLRNI